MIFMTHLMLAVLDFMFNSLVNKNEEILLHFVPLSLFKYTHPIS